jgi:putative restriction endonuclease
MGAHGHYCPTAHVIGWLGSYSAATLHTDVGAHPSVRLDPINEPQPTAALILSAGVGGQTRVSPDDFLEGGPELVAEVAADRASIDLNARLRLYGRNNVREYLVWRVRDAAIDWFVLRQGRYDPLPLGADGVYRSETFPGLWLDAAALVRTDIPAVLRTLQQGVTSPEYAAFVALLRNQSVTRP